MAVATSSLTEVIASTLKAKVLAPKMILALQEAFQKRLDGTGLLKDIEQEFFRLLLGFNSYLIVKIFINNYFSDFSINVFSSFYDNII